jgi:hypothetical protein
MDTCGSYLSFVGIHDSVKKDISDIDKCIGSFTRSDNCNKTLINILTHYRNIADDTVEKVDNLSLSIYEILNALFSCMHSTENNTYHFLRLFKEYNYFDFIHLEKYIEPSESEIELIESCELKDNDDDELVSELSLTLRKELGDNWKDLAKTQIPDTINENTELIEELNSLIDRGVTIRILINRMCRDIFKNDRIYIYEAINFLHSHHLRIVPVDDPDIPSPTLNEISLFSKFKNRWPLLHHLKIIQQTLTEYNKCSLLLQESYNTLIRCSKSIKELINNNTTAA